MSTLESLSKCSQLLVWVIWICVRNLNSINGNWGSFGHLMYLLGRFMLFWGYFWQFWSFFVKNFKFFRNFFCDFSVILMTKIALNRKYCHFRQIFSFSIRLHQNLSKLKPEISSVKIKNSSKKWWIGAKVAPWSTKSTLETIPCL